MADPLPDIALVGVGGVAHGERAGDLLRLARAPFRKQRPFRARERVRHVMPPPGLDARDGDGQARVGGHQDREVHHAVLLGADQLLAVQQQYRGPQVVQHAKLRDVAAIRHFGDAEVPGGERLVQGEVGGLLPRPMQQRDHGEVGERQGQAEVELVECMGEHVHVCSSSGSRVGVGKPVCGTLRGWGPLPFRCWFQYRWATVTGWVTPLALKPGHADAGH